MCIAVNCGKVTSFIGDQIIDQRQETHTFNG